MRHSDASNFKLKFPMENSSLTFLAPFFGQISARLHFISPRLSSDSDEIISSLQGFLFCQLLSEWITLNGAIPPAVLDEVLTPDGLALFNRFRVTPRAFQDKQPIQTRPEPKTCCEMVRSEHPFVDQTPHLAFLEIALSTQGSDEKLPVFVQENLGIFDQFLQEYPDAQMPIGTIRYGQWPDLLAERMAQTKLTAPLKLGVVMPAHNSEETLVSSVESVLAGLGADDRLCVVENGSSDATWAILEERYGKAENVILSQSQIASASAARNQAVELLQDMDFIGFCDSDDEWHPEKPAIIKIIVEGTAADIIFHPMICLGPKWRLEGDAFSDPAKDLPRNKSLLEDLISFGNFIPTSGVTIRTNLLHMPVFSEGIIVSQDFEAWCNIAKEHPHPRVAYFDQPLTYYLWNFGLSRQYWRMLGELHRSIWVYSTKLPFSSKVFLRTKSLLRLVFHGVKKREIVSSFKTAFTKIDRTVFREPQ